MQPQDYLPLCAIYLAAWILHGLVLVGVAAGLLGLPLDAERIGALLLANSLSMVAGFVAFFAPAGIGVREVALVAVLAPVMSTADAALLATASRLFSVLADVCAGCLALLPAHAPRGRDQSLER